MKRVIFSFALLLMAACSILIFNQPSRAAVESLTEGEQWSGTVTDSKYLSFTPEENGYYNTELSSDTQDVFTYGYIFETASQEWLVNFGEGNLHNALYMQQGVSYTILLECEYEIADDIASADMAFCITKSEDEIVQVGEQKISTTAFSDGNTVLSLKPQETGTYAFVFEPLGEQAYTTVLYQLENGKQIKKSTRNIDEGVSKSQYQLEAGKEYHLLVSIDDYNGDSEMPVNVQLIKEKNVTGIQIVNLDIEYPNPEKTWFGGSLELEIMFEDGSSENLQTDVYSWGAIGNGVDFEYLGAIDRNESHVAGQQPVRVTYLDEFVATTEITVPTKLEFATETLQEDDKKTASGNSYNMYRFTPKQNGFYTLWSQGGIRDYYEDWMIEMYDAEDTEIPFASNGDGFKLEAGKTYYLSIQLIGALTSDEFTYWMGINTDHVHSFGAWTVTKPATQTTAGEEKRICNTCGAIQTRVISPLGTTTSTPTTSPTATPVQNVNKVDSAMSPSLQIKKTSIKKAVSKAKKKINVSWKKVTGAQKYEVQYSLKKNMKKAKVKTVKGTKVTLKGLKRKKKYYVRVRAFKVVNGKKVYGAYSAKKTVRVK